MAQDSTVSTPVTFDRRTAAGPGRPVSVDSAVDELLHAADDGAVRDSRGRRLGAVALRELHWWLGGHLREALGRRTLRELRTRHLQDFVDSLQDAGVPSRRLGHGVDALRTLYRYALERGLAGADPTARLEIPDEPAAAAQRRHRVVARALELATAACALTAVGLVVATVA